jgi:hypothetical protein
MRLSFGKYFPFGYVHYPMQLMSDIASTDFLARHPFNSRQMFPFEAWGDRNLYGFSGNDPIDCYDLLGLSFWGRLGNGIVGIGAGAVAGAITGTMAGVVVAGLSGGTLSAGVPAGFVGGVIGGAISGFIGGVLTDPDFKPGPACINGAKAGAIGGAVGGGIGGGIYRGGGGPHGPSGPWSNQ